MRHVDRRYKRGVTRKLGGAQLSLLLGVAINDGRVESLEVLAWDERHVSVQLLILDDERGQREFCRRGRDFGAESLLRRSSQCREVGPIPC